MADVKIVWDNAGLSEALIRCTMGDVRAAAQAVAGNIAYDKIDLPIRVTVDVAQNMRIPRPRARVTIAHPAALRIQAKHGVLSRAAGAAGLSFHGFEG